MKCKLCLNERELVNSHIIPEFSYQNIYNEKLNKSNEKEEYILEFANFDDIIVHSSEAVKTEMKEIEIQTYKNKLLFSLEKNEVVSIAVELFL